MNKDDFDLLHQLSRDHTDLTIGLEDRRLGFFKKNARTKESIALFAEEQFVRKNDFVEMRCEMPGTPRSTFLMVFSPDGSKVASTHGNHNIYITDLRNGKNIKTLVGHPRTPWCIAFHPTSDQIVASGCLGGQVRIWDLSGGSEVWTTVNQSVIASLAFHPNDRVLAIATYNGIYFWDWSQPEPFVHAATYNIKEKVRFVAFDSLGHKLITGIANSPTTRWERVSAPVPVPRQERCASPYRRRITQRLVNNNTSTANENPVVATPSENLANISTRADLSYPERERRITMCYRTLVREYEQLVKRYLQLYRPPTMIDRGTDPMEPNALINNSGTQTTEPQPSTSGTATSAFVQHPRSSNSSSVQVVERAVPSTLRTVDSVDPGPSTSGYAGPSSSGSSQIVEPFTGESASVPSTSSQSPQKSSNNLLSPSRILSVIKKPNTLIRGTQTSESRKHKSEDSHELKGKRLKKNDGSKSKSEGNRAQRNEEPNTDNEQVPTPRRLVVIEIEKLREGDQESAIQLSDVGSFSDFARSIQNEVAADLQTDSRQTDPLPGSSRTNSRGGTGANSTVQSNVDELLSSIRRTAEQEVRKRILPIIRSVPADDRPELIRLFENSRERVRNSFRQRYPVVPRKEYGSLLNNLLSTTSDSSSSEEDLAPNTRLTRRNSEPSSSHGDSPVSGSTVSSTGASNSNPNIMSAGNSSTVRNFNTELEQLVTSLLTEIERNETDNTEASENTNVNTQTAAAPVEEPQDIPLPADYSDHWMPWRTPLPPFSVLMASTSAAPTAPSPASSSSPLSGSLLFQEFIQVFQNRRPEPERLRDSSFEPPATVINTNTSTTNSTVYTSSGGPANRRRFFSHRISAFMPTRVTYRRYPMSNFTHPNWRRSRTGAGQGSDQSFGIDELMNYSELENSEDESPPPPPPPDAEHPAEPTTQPEPSIGDMYSNIVQELESSLENLVRMRITTRPGEASNMLTRFSESLDNILNQSAVILRNLSGSVEMLSAPTATRRYSPPESSDPTTWSYFDPNFYVRDQRTDGLPPDPNPDETINLSDIFSSRPPFSAIESDHTYPRNPENVLEPPPPETSNPMVATIHLTMVHIQRQARILREQVDVIEQVDKAMLEVEQLQLVRRLTIELVRHVRRLSGESGPSTGGMSSVRQMMAGTRISDSAPYDLPAEDITPVPTSSAPSPPRPSSSRTGTAEAQAGSSGSSGVQPPTRSRANQRKTYPPSRMFRLARQCRRPSVWHFFSKRYSRATRPPNPAPPPSRSPVRAPTPAAQPNSRFQAPTYAAVDSDRLSLMTRRLEQLLNAQMRVFTAAEPARTNCRSIATIDLGEHILALRLHGCVLRMNRVLGNGVGSSTIGQLRADPTAAVSPDGMTRYGSRHLLSLVIDSVSRQIEELGTSNNIQQATRMQIHGVLAMSLLLTELLLLIVVDSIPPPINPTPERTSLTSRIDQLCGQMLQNRQCAYSQQLTRSLRLMKSTMRHANSTLGQIYNARRSSMLPRQFTDRRLLLGSINRCLRAINRRRQSHDDDTDNTGPSTSSSNADWYSTMSDLIDQYSILNRDDDVANTSLPSTSTSRERLSRPTQNDLSFSSNNDNTDDDDTEGFSVNSSNSSNLYRTNNVNLAPARDPAHVRPWNVPSVQVNDVPVSEPPGNLYAQRLISQRQRFAERVSELRSNPQLGLFRPRFLHPLYASVNPFDADLDDAQRDQIYDSDMITTVTPNHRIQAWDISDWSVPNIGSATRNIVVSECKIHNDASVDVAKDGTILVTLLPSGGYLNVTNRLGVYSLRWETLGQCLYTTSFERNAVSVSLSPLSRHLVVGLASRGVPRERWVMARVFKIDQKEEPGDRLPVIRELEQNQDCRINCIRWLPTSGQGLIYATNTGQLVVLS